MKKILLVATGGTIASQETVKGGMTPQIDAQGLLGFVPSVLQNYQVDMVQPMNIESSELTPDHWLPMVEAIEKNYNNYDGFVVTHGTDTLAYTAAALSYLIQNSGKTIVITGSQKPIDDEGTDAKKNLLDSFKFAADSNMSGVYVVFGGKVIIGTRAKKVRSRNFAGFDSGNFPDVGWISGDKIFKYCQLSPNVAFPTFYHQVCEDVVLIKNFPGMLVEDFQMLGSNHRAIVIESYSVGGIQTALLPVIKNWDKQGKTIIVGTQLIHEGTDLGVYTVGNAITRETNALQTYDMNIESAVAKIMFILGQTKDPAKIKAMFYQKVHEDIIGF